MSFKAQWQRDKLRKKAQKGFRGYPLATLAYYGPNDSQASKVVVGIVRSEGDEPELQKWHLETGDARVDPAILAAITALLGEHRITSIVAHDRIIGCPHQEGIDYPEGEVCPQCPFWANRDRFTGELIS